jgi:hypothetical protein
MPDLLAQELSTDAIGMLRQQCGSIAVQDARRRETDVMAFRREERSSPQTESSANSLEILFSMNIGFAVAYALFAFDGSHRIAVHTSEIVRDLLDAFSRMLLRIAPLAVHLRTRSAIIREAVFVALMFGIALLLYLLVRSFVRTADARLAFAAISGPATLIALPACWLYIVYATWGFKDDPVTFWGTYGSVSSGHGVALAPRRVGLEKILGSRLVVLR